MNRKAKIVVSDLHLSAGYADKGNVLEDFGSDAAFSEFLAGLVVESEEQGLHLEVIFAGDTFEFLQVPCLGHGESFDPAAHYRAEHYSPSSSEDSRTKMETIIEGHPLFFGALKGLVQATPPRRSLTFIKGNHDVNLHWHSVQEAIRAAIGATGELANCVSFEERRITREGIYVEHGHQYTERINRFPDFEEPHDPESPGELYLPAGSRFVLNVFNSLERQYYWMDGVKPLTALVWYMFALDFPLALRILGALLREVPSLFWGSLPVGWAIGHYLETRDHLLQRFDEDSLSRSLQSDLDQRSAFYSAVEAVMALYGMPQQDPDSRGTGGGGAETWRAFAVLPRGWAEEHAQRSALVKAAESKRTQEGAQVVVFGHTHESREEPLEDGAVYVNSGTWTWLRNFSGEDYAAWKRFLKSPEQYVADRRLSYVRIDYTEAGVPVGSLREFSREKPKKKGLLRRLFGWLRRNKAAGS